MRRALELAALGRGRVEPNPMVGAVIVKEGRVLGEGFHAVFGGPHAEIVALRNVEEQPADVPHEGESASELCVPSRNNLPRAAGSTLYVTLEPCAHYGKTPPCAPAIVEAAVARVVVATVDPLAPVHAASSRTASATATGGTAVLRQAGIKTDTGLCRDEAVMLNAAFFKRSCTSLPLVIAKWAMSADGKIATRAGASRWISCPDSRRMVHELRGRVDAIVVGRGTVARDDPLLTCREGEACRTAMRVVLCGRGAPNLSCNLVRTVAEAPVLLAHVEGAAPEGLEALEASGCELLPLPVAKGEPGAVDLRSLLSALGARGASNVLVEGGRHVLGSFFDERLVDKVMIFVAPFVIGGAEAVTAVGGRGVESVKAAIPLIGREFLPFAEETLPQAPQTTVRPVGRDVLIESWITDPMQWAP